MYTLLFLQVHLLLLFSFVHDRVMPKQKAHLSNAVVDESSNLSLNDGTILLQTSYSYQPIFLICSYETLAMFSFISVNDLMTIQYSSYRACHYEPLIIQHAILENQLLALPSTNSLGIDVIRQRETQAIVFINLG